MRKRNFLAAAVTFGANWTIAQPGELRLPIRVAAASDLQFAFADLATQYRKKSAQPIQLSLGSSGHFAQQIRHGLEVDLFMSADEAFVLELAEAGLTQGKGVVYALGRIALLVPAASAMVLDPELRGLREALPGLLHFAIANPVHAPYGRAAQQALQRTGLWELVRGKLVIGENIAQATQFVTSAAAQAGISAASLALAPEVARATRALKLPSELHAPLRQRMALLRSARSGAAQFYDYLQSPEARAILQRHGFDI